MEIRPCSAENLMEIGPGNTENLMEIGPCSAENLMEIGPRSTENLMEIGPRSAENLMEIGPRSAENLMEIGPRSTENLVVIGLSMAFHQVIGLSMAFHQVIGLPVTFQVIGLSVAFHQEQQARDDREGDGQWEPTQIDLLSVIATGARQLQDAQTKAFQKKSSQEEPEPVKPGVTSLPTLKGPDPETSPVEVQDWLQLLQAPMSDLSDNSAEWWGRVQELAQRAYQGWSSATPMEWLALRAPREKELEEGRFARLNARAASMILSSLDETFGLGSPSSSSEAD
eukprot:s3369_g5.t1